MSACMQSNFRHAVPFEVTLHCLNVPSYFTQSCPWYNLTNTVPFHPRPTHLNSRWPVLLDSSPFYARSSAIQSYPVSLWAFSRFILHYQRPDCQSKATCNQVSVVALHKLSQFLFGNTSSTALIAPICFLWEILAAKVITSDKNWIAVFFCHFWAGNKKIAKIRAGSLSPLTGSPLVSALAATPLVLEVRHVPACPRKKKPMRRQKGTSTQSSQHRP